MIGIILLLRCCGMKVTRVDMGFWREEEKVLID